MTLKSHGTSNQLNDAQRFQLLVDSVSDYAIYMLDPDGIVTSWNTGAQKIKGYRPHEIIGQSFARFFIPEDQASGVPARALARALAGDFQGEGWRVRKDGNRFWASTTLQPIRDQAGVVIGFAKITRDITERQQAQDTLLESERRFRILVEGVTDYAIYMLDPSGIVSNWNTGAQRLKGYTADEIVGQHFSRFYSKEDRAAGLPGRVLEIAGREGRYESEGWRIRKDGTRFWASVVVDAIKGENGELIGFAKITRDITERRAAQEALRESQRQLQRLIGGVTDYALYMVDLNGLITSWNAGAERIKGYTAGEIIGQHFSRFYTEREREAGLPARALQIAEKEGRYEAEGWRVRKDGTAFWANVIIDPIREEPDGLVGFAKITRDITERRNAQIAQQAAQAQLAYAQKMDALGQLTGGVAHDFNNLLMIVSGNLPAIKKMVADNPRGVRAAEAIELAAKRGATLTRQLLTFSRRQALNPEVIGVGERIESFRAVLASSVGATSRLIVTILPDVWPIEVDAGELELAVLNVTLNGRDAMPQGGVISITAENVDLKPGDTSRDLAGEFVALTVADTGDGIAPDILSKVFDPFFTTKGLNKGTGLGLSQVHGFAHQSGGTVTIDSELGKGTRVTIYLPRARASGQAASEREIEASGEGTVLLVEDNPDVAEVTVTMLGDMGYQVRTAPDAAAALAAIDKQNFDLVVSDIVMAGAMDGFGLARELRRRHPDLPIVLVTGYSDAAGPAAGEFTVLRKPYQVTDLSRALAKVTAESGRCDPGNLVRLHDVKRNATPERT